jgi:hypothetical protein
LQRVVDRLVAPEAQAQQVNYKNIAWDWNTRAETVNGVLTIPKCGTGELSANAKRNEATHVCEVRRECQGESIQTCATRNHRSDSVVIIVVVFVAESRRPSRRS